MTVTWTGSPPHDQVSTLDPQGAVEAPPYDRGAQDVRTRIGLKASGSLAERDSDLDDVIDSEVIAVVGAAGLEPTTPGFGGHRRRSVAIRSGAKHPKFIGFFATSLTHRAESNRLITHLGIRGVYGFWVVSELTTGRATCICRPGSKCQPLCYARQKLLTRSPAEGR